MRVTRLIPQKAYSASFAQSKDADEGTQATREGRTASSLFSVLVKKSPLLLDMEAMHELLLRGHSIDRERLNVSGEEAVTILRFIELAVAAIKQRRGAPTSDDPHI